MRVVGTAGHVDHGKSTLIQALTGIHPDRLKEEQEREMTIDLGFAWVTLPGGEEIGIVDVPGHRDFIENMLAGVGGIDAVIFVVAADEGIMPQTREHLAILDLLDIPGGVIVLTKIDLVDDPDWIDLVEEEILQTMTGTILQNAPIIRVSARRSEGIQELVSALEAELKNHPQRLDLGRPRLPADRIFTMSGFGTIVTGTLSDGVLHIGEEIEVLPVGYRGRIRGLQNHRKKMTEAVPGSRTAINISGVEHTAIKRGDVLAHPKDYRATRRVDVKFRLLPDVTAALKHNTFAKFFTGAAETMCRLRLLGIEQLDPGQSGWLQLELQEPVVCVRGDHYILRRPSPSETLGGGSVVDDQPAGRHKRFSKGLIQRLDALAQGSPEDIIEHFIAETGLFQLKDLTIRTGLQADVALKSINNLFQADKIVIFDDGTDIQIPTSESYLISRQNWDQFTRKSLDILQKFHNQYPLRLGMPREELKSRLHLQTRQFNILYTKLKRDNLLNEIDGLVKVTEHQIVFSPAQIIQIHELKNIFQANPFSPPSVKDCQKLVSEEVYIALCELGDLIQVSQEVVFRNIEFDIIKQKTIDHLKLNNKITVAETRDQFQTSRKYALAILEFFDAKGITTRDGDFRRLGPNS